MDIKTLKTISKINTAMMLINLIILPIVIYGFIIREPFAVVVSIMALSVVCLINRYKVFGNVLLALLVVIIAQLFRFIDLSRNERSGYTVMLFFMLILVGVREMCSHYIHKQKREAELEAMVKTGHVEGYCNHPNMNSRAEGYASHNRGCSHVSGEAAPDYAEYAKLFPGDAKITHVKENSENETTV